MFALSKLVGMIVHPISTGILLLAIGLVFAKTRFRKVSTGFLLASFAYLAVVAYTPLSAWLILPLEQRFERAELPEKVDGIISLGGGIDSVVSVPRNVVEHGNASDRLYETVVLAKQFPRAKVVYTGGSGRVFGDKFRSADIAETYFKSLGLDPSRIILEPQARNTAENVSYTKRLVEPSKDEVWIVVTSAFHMPRAMGLFQRADWRVLPWPSDYQTGGTAARWDFRNDITSNLIAAEVAIKEWVGLLSYYLLGRTDQVLPGPAS